MLVFTIIIALFGLALGSFANCLIWRLYRQEKISGRSYCPRCSKQLFWYDNIPLLSYLFLRGRCRFCRERISWQYPAVEAAVAGLFVFFWLQRLDFTFLNFEELSAAVQVPYFWLGLSRDFLAAWVLTVILVFDLRFYLISNLVVIPASLIFIVINLLLGTPWYLLVVMIVAAVAFFGLQFVATRGRGLGEGDIWLGLLLGTLFSNGNYLILAIFSAYMIGTVVGLGLILAGRKSWTSKLPLGVFLALGALIALAWGPEFISSYWTWF